MTTRNFFLVVVAVAIAALVVFGASIHAMIGAANRAIDASKMCEPCAVSSPVEPTCLCVGDQKPKGFSIVKAKEAK